MHGKNEVAKIDQRLDGTLNVNSMWSTLQGEGPDAGRPAVFVRLAKCNLRCYFCDTEFEIGDLMSADVVAETILELARKTAVELVVITGGEPLLQNIMPVVNLLNDDGREVAVETAGTVYLPGIEQAFAPDRSIGGNIIVCSPKTPRLDPRLIPYIGAYKYIVKAGQNSSADGLPIMATQRLGHEIELYRPTPIGAPYSVVGFGGHSVLVPIYLQAMDEESPSHNQANIEEAARLCMKHGYRLSVQTHKIAGVP